MPFEPFIVTAEMPRDLLSWANGLRAKHFPAERNRLHAHVTLFHALSPSLLGELKPLLSRIAGEYSAVAARLNGVMDLGKGTALAIASPAMLAIRAEIAEHFHGALTAQDDHPPRLHITVQNKVERTAALALQQELGCIELTREFRFAGLGLHIYRGGPWETIGLWPFRGKQGG
ncbi:MAG: 2'-5' RNA ligase family protein [Novosphingobium sp.]